MTPPGRSPFKADRAAEREAPAPHPSFRQVEREDRGLAHDIAVEADRIGTPMSLMLGQLVRLGWEAHRRAHPAARSTEDGRPVDPPFGRLSMSKNP